MEKRYGLLFMAVTVLLGCSPKKAEVKTVAASRDRTIIIKPEINKVSPQFFIGKVLSIIPLKNRKGFYLLRIKATDGKLFNVQIDSRYLTKGLTIFMGDTVRIYGYSPYAGAIVPFKIFSTKAETIYSYTPYWKANSPKR